MKLSKSQLNELEVWKHFIPQNLRNIAIKDSDIKKFFEWSEQGKHKEELSVPIYENPDGFFALYQGKKWAGIHIHELYEPGILDLSMPYFTILGGYDITIKRKWWQFWKQKYTHRHNPPPRPVVEFMKKEMFKGIDSEIIEKCYQELRGLNQGE